MKLRKRDQKNNKYTEGYVLLEALISIIILSIFMSSIAGLYSSMTKNTIKAETAFAEYLNTYNENIDSRKFLFYEE